MGRITKAATDKHEATLSPFISSFVKASTEIPLYQLPSHLANFPRKWPFVKGDLYHWIPLLNRFDRILELFVKEYGLDKGPQTREFTCRLLLKGDAEEGQPSPAVPSEATLSNVGFSRQGDKELVESILSFTRLLFEQCGNRSLYNSSAYLHDLLNTTSLPLLKATLRLSLRLAQRYYTTRQRYGAAAPSFLMSNYNISLDKMLKLASTFVAPTAPSAGTVATATPKGKEKASTAASSHAGSVDAADFSRIIRETNPAVWRDWGHIVFTYYESTGQQEQAKQTRDEPNPALPTTPTPIRRTSSLVTSQSANSNQQAASDDTSSAIAPGASGTGTAHRDGPKVIDIPFSQVTKSTAEELLDAKLSILPDDSRFDFLNRVRTSYAVLKSPSDREDLVSIRLLAIANLAYMYTETNFAQKIAQMDSDQPRQLQIVQQLAQLIQPSQEHDLPFSMELQTIVFNTFEALGKQKQKASDIMAALNVNVNHGVLFYVMRKAAAQIATTESYPDSTTEEEWREALFSLLIALPGSSHSSRNVAEQMVSAGVLDILVEVLKLRTDKAEQSQGKILNFLDNFVHNVRDAYLALINARGFDAIADLVADQVRTSHERVLKHDGMPIEFKNQSTDWQIPYFQQSTLRWLFKVINHFMSHSGGTFDRMLRNLIDSSQLLGGLRVVIGEPEIYGSQIWSSAVTVVSNFIHHEPTSYQVIAEAGLSRQFLEIVSSNPIEESEQARPESARETDSASGPSAPNGTGDKSEASRRAYFNILRAFRTRDYDLAAGILPNADAIVVVPDAFEAICLNENGQKLFKKSNALKAFFEIFESQKHVGVMANEPNVPSGLGARFDEMVRHHPQLKTEVMACVKEMIVRVGALVSQRAEIKGVGAKLWYETPDGTLMVCGGRAALGGQPDSSEVVSSDREGNGDINMGEASSTHDIPAKSEAEIVDEENPEEGPTGDINMEEASSIQNIPAESEAENEEVPIELIVDEENPEEGPTCADYISALSLFLSGFFNGTSRTIEAFFETYGAENILDLLTAPSLAYNYATSSHSDAPVEAIKMLVEQKPHLIMPSLLQRTQLAVDYLKPFIEHDDAKLAFFAPLTQQSKSDLAAKADWAPIVKEKGTLFAKTLLSVRLLCKTLNTALSVSSFNQRLPNSIFNQVNLADKYAQLVEDLGKLNRSCVWEELQLQYKLSPHWEKATRGKSFGLGSNMDDELFGASDPLESVSQSNNAQPDASAGATTTSSERPTPSRSKSWRESAEFKNVRTLRHLMGKTYTFIAPLLHTLGSTLLTNNRRSTHNTDLHIQQKQNAVLVAEKLAEAAMGLLTYKLPPSNGSIGSLYSYWVLSISQLSQIIIGATGDRNYPQLLTLVIQQFKDQGSIRVLNHIMTAFYENITRKVAEGVGSNWQEWPMAIGGLKFILEFYSQITSSKMLMEATQTGAMSSRPTQDRDKPDYFIPDQFTVELRKEIIEPVRKIWSSSVMEKGDSIIAIMVIDLLRTILEGEGEQSAYKRADKVPVRSKPPRRLWKASRGGNLESLKDKGFSEELAKEALYRCYDAYRVADEYCTQATNDFRFMRSPIPAGEEAPPQSGTGTPAGPSSTSAVPQPQSQGSSAAPEPSTTGPPHFTSAQVEQAVQALSTEGMDETMRQVIQNVAESVAAGGNIVFDSESGNVDTEDLAMVDMDAEPSGANETSGPSATMSAPTASPKVEVTEAANLPQCATVDDLEEDRAELRSNLIDRCLDIVDLHEDVSFNLSDLIAAAVARAGNQPSMRTEISSTLMFSLLSLREDDIASNGKKVAAYAHLLGLVIQDKSFYEAARSEMTESFSTLLDFVKIPQLKQGESASWVAPVLLIAERALAQDEQPYQISWAAPTSDEPAPNDTSVAQLDHEPIAYDEKEKLFKVIIDLLPRIGKDGALALSVLRILVILTRNPVLAKQLGAKVCMQKLFVMIKQLAGATNDKLQEAFMLVLRHVVEDKETLRQIMCSEIRSAFESRGQSRLDTTQYTRHFYHLILREPSMFVEVTNELLTLSRWDPSTRPQVLTLKKPEKPESTSKQPVASTSGSPQDAGEAKEPAEQSNKQEEDRPKTADMKAPLVENPDGVIHYLLCELLSYKDVEEREPATTDSSKSNGEDVDMTGSDNTGPSSSTSTPAPTDLSAKKANKTDFKADDHPIYIYRCFILHCLSELLGSYNRTKVEFINFSRKSDPQTMTPSKPRSGVLNYLLNALVPTGSITHSETTAYKKSFSTSSWAISVVVSLCAKTGEHLFGRDPQDVQDESELVFVRKFVLEHALKSYRDAQASDEPLDMKYSRLLNLAEIFNRMLTGEANVGKSTFPYQAATASQKQLGRIMYEKNFISALTSSISEIDLNFPSSRRAIKYILRPLKLLTQKAYDLSMTSEISSSPAQTTDEDEISSASSVTDPDDIREETPDLFRNSTLGLMRSGGHAESGGSDEDSEDEGDDDDEMYGDEYEDEMDYEDERDDDEPVSDEDDEAMGGVEGLPGDLSMDIEIIEDEEDSDSSVDESDDSDEDDEDHDMEDGEDIDADDHEDDVAIGLDANDGHAVLEIGDAEGVDDEDWEEEDDNGAFELHEHGDEDGSSGHDNPRGRLLQVLGEGDSSAMLDQIMNGELPVDIEQEYLEDDMQPDPDEDDEDEDEADYDEEEVILEENYQGRNDPNSLDAQDIYDPFANDIPNPHINKVFQELQEEGRVLSGDNAFVEVPEASLGMHSFFRTSADQTAIDDDADVPGMWEWRQPPQGLLRGHHTHNHHRHGGPFALFRGLPNERTSRTLRTHPHRGTQRPNDNGMNPLLRNRNPSDGEDPTDRPGRGLLPPLPMSWGENARSSRLNRRGGRPGIVLPGVPFPTDGMNLINHILGSIHGPTGRDGLPMDIQLTGGLSRALQLPGGIPHPRDLDILLDRQPAQDSNFRLDDPAKAVAFTPTLTTTRWQDEARLLFQSDYIEKATRVINSILKLLVPPAIEEKKRRDEETAKKKAEEEAEAARKKKEQEEREAQLKQEREEREAREREEEEARRREEEAARQAEQEAQEQIPDDAAAADSMEGVESTQPVQASEAVGESSEPQEDTRPRIMYTFRGQELDITDLGIDVDYLEALPEELREEVLQNQVLEQRARAADTGQESTASFDQEFLQALPPDIREEVLRQEAIDRRRREANEARRRATASTGAPARAEEMDTANFFATLDPSFRQQILMEQDDNILSQLPEDIANEARSYGGRHNFMSSGGPSRFRGRTRDPTGDMEGDLMPTQTKPQRRQVVQMLDKPGVATLLRLMFIPLQGSMKTTMNGILRDVCENRTNRSEVITLLLSILQDGSYDSNAVERSFSQLSLRAKQPPSQKTPQQGLKRTLTGPQSLPSNTDMSPLMVVQQCLSTLNFLTQYNGHIPSFFLTAHESNFTIGVRPNKKGKGKETKGSKFALNALLGLLDRKLVVESSPIMEELATLLTTVTHPLQMLGKKKEKTEEEKKEPANGEDSSSRQAEETGRSSGTALPDASAIEGATNQTPASAPTQSDSTVQPLAAAETASKENESKEVGDKSKKHRDLVPPEIPEHNFRLVVNIFTARECSSKTFKDTIALMNNLSHITDARDIFGKELINSAQDLAASICLDLQDLVHQVEKAQTGTDVQGLALSKFSPTSSDQTKILRVLTALDYLFDPKRADFQEKPKSSVEALSSEQKSEILTTLYNDQIFTGLWTRLSDCLRAIRQRENMFNVAQILSPLIESFMVVCKNTAIKDVPLSKPSKEVALSSPAPESQMENLFYMFTEEHRKILNDLVRHNPKLMSGTFSLLVKNSKILEFDNKRNYFNRRLHNQSRMEQTVRHPPLQLSVRRDHVFLDSFKSLYFKHADEVKFGKLSIRFHGEEGVDAGGVTREWFQALARQMFNPGYALFQSVASDRTTFHPSRLSSVNDQHLMFFKFIGRIIGKALYEGRVLDCHFSRAVYKRILGKSVSVKDMESLDLEYYKSLIWMLDNDITDVITETFSVQVDDFGRTDTVDLIENGRNIPVTEENKAQYVQLITEHKMTGCVSEQLEHFLTGFHDIVPAELISIFNEQELELLISGLPDIDIDDWRNNTDYHNYTATSPQIQWFWRAVRSFDKEERAKLLQFVTGTSKVPLNGFKELEGMNGFSKFNIHRDFGRTERLPSSHTCFNQLDLPEYENYDDLRKQLYTAFTAGSEYFGFA
ncbi:MAG: hypothetical protein M1820_003865 [Bogoriella megaspora]|nr:MAG: hypothetical protein M1820_003865 [Bogoriella megaspora]